MKSKSTKVSEKLSDRATEEKNVKNRLCLLELQLAELKRKGSYITVSFHRTKITSTRRGERYKHFYRIRFFIGVTNLKKLKLKTHGFHESSHSLSAFLSSFFCQVLFGAESKEMKVIRLIGMNG
ncbi:uncharacterized protein DS421_4g130890 [Arachis hypogaea]|nr:uncharacterized protein DS421_4g130890 [Arachis hypogaea]